MYILFITSIILSLSNIYIVYRNNKIVDKVYKNLLQFRIYDILEREIINREEFSINELNKIRLIKNVSIKYDEYNFYHSLLCFYIKKLCYIKIFKEPDDYYIISLEIINYKYYNKYPIKSYYRIDGFYSLLKILKRI